MEEQTFYLHLSRPFMGGSPDGMLYEYVEDIAKKAAKREHRELILERNGYNTPLNLKEYFLNRKERREIRKNIENGLFRKLEWYFKTNNLRLIRDGDRDLIAIECKPNRESVIEKIKEVNQGLGDIFNEYKVPGEIKSWL